MKELHFYIQSLMFLLALACGLQGFLNGEGFIYAMMIQFFLGIYQYGMSWFLMKKLRRPAPLLSIYFLAANLYLIILIFMSLNKRSFDDLQWQVFLFGLPWVLAIYFIVVIEDLLWVR